MPDNNPKRQLIFVTHPNVQSRSLGDLLAKECGASFLLRTSLESCLDAAALGERRTVILVDCTLIPPAQAFSLLEMHISPLPRHLYVGLMNAQLDDDERREAVVRGIRAFFTPTDDLGLLVRGINTLFEGEIWISRRILYEVVVDSYRRQSSHGNNRYALTTREVQVLTMISDGSSNEEIANKLFISTNTVKTHLYHIYKKLRVPNRMQAALWAAKHL